MSQWCEKDLRYKHGIQIVFIPEIQRSEENFKTCNKTMFLF